MMESLNLPTTYKKLTCTKLSQNFSDVVSVTEEKMRNPGKGEVLVKNRFVGINASDIYYTSGGYVEGNKPPFDCGFEGVGEVVSVGPGSSLSVGQPVLYTMFGAFSEYKIVTANRAIKLPRISADYLPPQISGATAGVALDLLGDLKPGEIVVVTAAAGGTGQFAVQWAKKAGCHVIGTCSTDEKVEFLKRLGCDRPVNYKKESLKDVLDREYKDGVDVVYESVGGEIFQVCLNALRLLGRMLIIGHITNYKAEDGFTKPVATIPGGILGKSISIRAFALFHFPKEWISCVNKMINMIDKKELISLVDKGDNSPDGPFIGIEKIVDAVEHLYSQKNKGKVVVELNRPDYSKL